MRKVATVLVTLAAAASLACSTMTTAVDYDHTVDWSKYKTFQLATGTPAPTTFVQKRIDDAITSTLDLQGLAAGDEQSQYRRLSACRALRADAAEHDEHGRLRLPRLGRLGRRDDDHHGPEDPDRHPRHRPRRPCDEGDGLARHGLGPGLRQGRGLREGRTRRCRSSSRTSRRPRAASKSGLDTPAAGSSGRRSSDTFSTRWPMDSKALRRIAVGCVSGDCPRRIRRPSPAAHPQGRVRHEGRRDAPSRPLCRHVRLGQLCRRARPGGQDRHRGARARSVRLRPARPVRLEALHLRCELRSPRGGPVRQHRDRLSASGRGRLDGHRPLAAVGHSVDARLAPAGPAAARARRSRHDVSLRVLRSDRPLQRHPDGHGPQPGPEQHGARDVDQRAFVPRHRVLRQGEEVARDGLALLRHQQQEERPRLDDGQRLHVHVGPRPRLRDARQDVQRLGRRRGLRPVAGDVDQGDRRAAGRPRRTRPQINGVGPEFTTLQGALTLRYFWQFGGKFTTRGQGAYVQFAMPLPF